jgi:signal transduction histidine kinase
MAGVYMALKQDSKDGRKTPPCSGPGINRHLHKDHADTPNGMGTPAADPRATVRESIDDLLKNGDRLRSVVASDPESMILVDVRGSVFYSNPPDVPSSSSNQGADAATMKSDGIGVCHPDGTPWTVDDLPFWRAFEEGKAVADHEMLLQWPDGQMQRLVSHSFPAFDHQGRLSGVAALFQHTTEPEGEQDPIKHGQSGLKQQRSQHAQILAEADEALVAEMDERRQVEKQLAISNETLRQMSRRALIALEADRRTVAKELHDSIGASLAAIKFSLEDILDQRRHGRADANEALGKVITYLKQTIKETKRISTALRPSTLDDLGLLSTIRWHCREMATMYSGIAIRQNIHLQDSDVPGELGIVIFRVLQEAVNNATKHAMPTTIDIHLSRDGDNVFMTVADDGCGFDPNDSRMTDDPMHGNGIAGMRERVALCNGCFSLYSRKSEGTRVEVKLPVND